MEFTGEPSAATPTAGEIDYLCRAVNAYFRAQIGPKQVVGVFAGVRALYDDGSGKPEDVTRDYHLTLDGRGHTAPLLTIYGGKITTYRRLAEEALRPACALFARHAALDRARGAARRRFRA